jgi:hypothetical protein
MKPLARVARVVIVALACVVSTSWFGWMSLPVVGFVYALLDRRADARGSIAALGAVLAWLAILGGEAARGANVRLVASDMGKVLHVPSAMFLLLTLLFAAVLCGTAGVLGSAVASSTFARRDS